MTAIIPRWEWRTFGSRFGAADAAFAAMESTGVQESDELYLLSVEGQNVKVRDGLMDIKLLRDVDADGLERWEPVMKATFPLTSEEAAAVADALRIARPPVGHERWTLDEFLAELAGPEGPIRAVPVHKRRVRYRVGGCTCEVSEVTAEGSSTRTIAIESEDAAAVVAAARSVGLGGYANISYPRGLRDLVDGSPERYAVIDVGTNSVKFHVAELADDGGFRAVLDRAEVTRLGEGLAERGTIADEALERTALAISVMAQEARDLRARAVAAVGTAGLRIAANGGAAIEAIRERSGITVEVISGEDESRLAYRAVVAGLDIGAGTAVVFDTGGGSSQFTFGHGGVVDERFSVEVGAARFTERFRLDRAVGAEVVQEACAAIAGELSRLGGRPRPDRLVGMGGGITNLTAVKLGLATYDPDAVQGARLDRDEIDRQIERYRSTDADGRRSITGLQPKRAEVILAGACIVRTVMDLLGHASLTVSDRGLRHGVLLERFGEPGTKGDQR
jgi:exopolyphosphatase/guanosine-5'-triphosphate,3'-diphosphate pyrophosphatase